METAKIFLEKLIQDINDGKYDDHLSVPFMTRELILTSFKSKLQKKVESGGTPVLSDADIKNCIHDAKEASGFAFNLYEKFGFLEKTEDGLYEVTRKGKLAIKHSQLM
jgi:hypothetical protein